MPSDTATQHQLGLFLGYPVWWKRRMQELARVTPSSAAAAAPAAAEGGSGGGGGGGGQGVEGGRGDTGGVRGSGSGSGLGERGGGRLMITGGSSRLGDGGAGGGLGNGLTGGGRLGNVGGNGTRFAAGSVEGEGDRSSGLLSSQLPRQACVVPNGGLAASRWSNGPARDKALPPSWRTAASAKGSPQSPYAERTLQTYDGASSIDECEPVYPWDEQHYRNLRAVQTQTQQQQQHPQSQPGNEGSGFNAACNFGESPPPSSPLLTCPHPLAWQAGRAVCQSGIGVSTTLSPPTTASPLPPSFPTN
jgi:hypothetical protein